MAVVPVTSVALGVVPPEHSGMAAGATTTSRELGSVVGVAVLGSLVNGTLTVDLTRRLAELGVPAGFRTVVINASRPARCPRAAAAAAAAEKAFGPIVAHVIDAAYGAFRTGCQHLARRGRRRHPRLGAGRLGHAAAGAGPSSSRSRRGSGDRAPRPSGRLEQGFRLERPRRRLVVLEHEVDVEALAEGSRRDRAAMAARSSSE